MEDLSLFGGKRIETSLKPNFFMMLLKCFWKFLGTFFLIGTVAVVVSFANLVLYIYSVANDPAQSHLPTAGKLDLTSVVYIPDGKGGFKEYLSVHGEENRTWVSFEKIPKAMKDAIIAIEDKRFLSHNGVDFKRTLGAFRSLIFGGKNTYGGSTLTQQTVKNLSNDKEVSITRKIREIFRSLNLEKDLSKDEILEQYLNIVNFGSGSHGVQAAARTYFNKDISECTVAECAAIAGITQNPSKYSPLIYPENNKERRETVLLAMKEQKKINDEEYEKAKKESDTMKFSFGKSTDEEKAPVKSESVYNWYIEAMLSDIKKDLAAKLKIGPALAEDMVYRQGLKIYCAIDENAQNIAEAAFKDKSLMSDDPDLELGFVMLDPNDGRMLATVGGRKEKIANLVFDRANYPGRQPGSSMKPIAAYAPAIDAGLFNFSSLISNEKIPNYFGPGQPGPYNWSYADGGRTVTLSYAIEHSINIAAVQTLRALGPSKSVDFLTKKLGFEGIDHESDGFLPLAIGGVHKGVSVKEMTAAYQIFGSKKNMGVYHKPYTYFMVQDKEGKTLLDNTNNPPIQAVSSDTGLIMNKLLRNAVVGPNALARKADVPNWEIIGKTGTTDKDKDYWFIGGTPIVYAGLWYGYDDPKPTRQVDREGAKGVWRTIMQRYLEGKKKEEFFFDYSNIVKAEFCSISGELAGSGCPKSGVVGYYSKNNLPKICHIHGASTSEPNSTEAPEEHEYHNNSTTSEQSEQKPNESIAVNRTASSAGINRDAELSNTREIAEAIPQDTPPP